VTKELAEILKEAQSRGSLIDSHPDLKPVPVEAIPPQYVPIRSFHHPPAKRGDWKTDKAPLPSGYGITQEMLDEYTRKP
jgi:hypothetical protein